MPYHLSTTTSRQPPGKSLEAALSRQPPGNHKQRTWSRERGACSTHKKIQLNRDCRALIRARNDGEFEIAAVMIKTEIAALRSQ